MRAQLENLVMRHVAAENAHDMAATLATLHPDCSFEDVALGRRWHGHAGAREHYGMWWDAFDLMVAPRPDDRRYWTENGHYIAETWFRGRHVGPFLGIAPTGRDIAFRFVVFVDFRDGLLLTERFYYNLADIGRQIGAELPGSRA